MKKPYKILGALIGAPLLLIAGASVYANQFPDSLSRFIPSIIDAALKDTPYQMAFKRAEISHVSFDGTVSLTLKELSILNDAQPITHVPEAVIVASWWRGILGDSAIERVTLEKPNLVLVRMMNGQVTLTSGAREKAMHSEAIAPVTEKEAVSAESLTVEATPVTERLEDEVQESTDQEVATDKARAPDEMAMSQSVASTDLAQEKVAVKSEPLNAVLASAFKRIPHAIAMHDASITMIDEAEQTNVQWKDVSLSLAKEDADESWKGTGRASLQLPEGDALMTLNAAVEESGDADIEIEFNALDTASLCAVKPKVCGEFAELSVPLSGEIHLLVGDEPLPNVTVSLAAQNVALTHPTLFPQDTLLKEYQIVSSYDANRETLKIETAKFVLDEGEFSASGMAALEDGAVGAELALQGGGMNLASLGNYWPVGMAHDAREWVTNNLPVGRVETVNATFNITPEQMHSGEIPKEAVFAEVSVSSGEVYYLPNYPHVRNVAAKALINAESMHVLVSEGLTLTDTKLEEGEVRIPDFSAAGVPMEIDLRVDASARDVATFINAPHYSFAKPLTLKPKEISGRATGQIALKFNTASVEPEAAIEGESEKAIEAKLSEEMGEVFYDIKAELHKLSQAKVKERWDFTNVDASLQADATGVSMKGVGNIHGVPSRFSVEDRLGKPTNYSFKGKVPKAKFGLFDLPDSDMVSGWAEVDADVTLLSKTRQKSKVSLGLKDAKIEVPAIGWVKNEGEASALSFIANSHQNGDAELSDLSFNSDVLSFSGTANMSAGLQMNALNLVSLRTGQHTASLNMVQRNGIYDVKVSGQGVDLLALETAPETDVSSGGFSISTLPRMKLNIDMKSFVLSKEAALKNINAQLDCSASNGRCGFANLSAVLPKGDALVTRIYRDEEGKRRLSLATDDGAGLVKLLGIHDEIEGGKLNIRGEYLDQEKGAPFKGRLVMEKFTLRNAPILSKLLSLGSFTGMIDMLKGNGLKFDKLVSNFRFVNDVMSIEDSQLKGNTLGATLSGKVSIAKSMLDLKGSLLPSYFLNTLINNVPVIGDLITGGKGEGLIGVRYSVKGNAAKPEVSVNPLSALTPGFTRGIFDAFNSSDFDKADDADEPAPEAEKTYKLEQGLEALPVVDVEEVPAQ